MLRTIKENQLIEKGVIFLVNRFTESCHNEKPVILHSLRTGFYLYNQGYSLEIVIAGFLHDLIEDSDTQAKELEERFGEKVRKLVEANSFDQTLKGKEARYLDTFKKCLKAGKEALVVKAADILDNFPYHSWPNDPYATKKIETFIGLARPLLQEDIVFKELVRKFKRSRQK